MDYKDLKIQELKKENEKLKKQIEELVENGLDPIEMCEVKMLIGEFLEYNRLKEQGLLLIPKCGEGDTLYEIHPLTGYISERLITCIRIIRSPNFMILYESGTYPIIEDCIGKTVFLTEQEAQAALEKMKYASIQ